MTPTPLTPSANAASTRIPGVTLRVDGHELDAAAGRLAAVRVRREASAPAACELTFEDPADAASLERDLAPGTSIDVAVAGQPVPLFTGELLVLERRFRPDGTLEIAARAQDRTHRLRAGSRMRVFVDLTVGGLARELASEAGLGLTGDDASLRLPRLVQDGRSSLDLLTSTTRRAGLWWQVDPDDTQLCLYGPGGTGAIATATRGDTLLEASVTTSLLAPAASWKVVGWDAGTGDQVTGSADPARAASGQAMIAGQGIVPDAADADALARGLVADDDALAHVLRAVVQGDTALAPGYELVVDGLTPDADGSYVLTGADHRIDAATGYTCTVTSAPPDHLRLRRNLGTDAAGPAGAAITVGQVLAIDDPASLGRVRVGLDAYEGVESEWLPVIALGAGDGKGLALQPDVGDRVVIAHDSGDPARGIVLGGLRTSDGGEPGVGVVDGAVGVYGMRLPTGQSVRMSAHRDVVQLRNRLGSSVEISEDGIVVHGEGDLVLEAPGRVLRLRAKSIEMEQA